MFEDGEVEVFKAGESWAEMPGEYGVTGNEGPVLARVSSALLVPKGQNPATPKPGSRPPQVRPTSIYSSTLPGITQPGEFELVHLTLDFAPGSVTPLHTHGGPGLVLVLEGEISNAVEGKPKQTVKTGQSWVEMPGEYAIVGNKGATKARVSFAVVLPNGASLTTVRPPAIPVEQPPVAPVEQPTMPIASPAETIGMPRTGTSDLNILLPVALTLGLLLVALGRIVHVLRPKHT